jgi:hypothetical protein
MHEHGGVPHWEPVTQLGCDFAVAQMKECSPRMPSVAL